MTKENRAERHICPDCENKPILQQGGDMFCDLCNKYIDSQVLAS